MLHTHTSPVRRSTLAVFGAIGLALVVTVTSQAASVVGHTNYLTFSGAVALPGMVLPAGTYTFSIANPNTSANAVRVRVGTGVFSSKVSRSTCRGRRDCRRTAWCHWASRRRARHRRSSLGTPAAHRAGIGSFTGNRTLTAMALKGTMHRVYIVPSPGTGSFRRRARVPRRNLDASR